MAMDRGAFRAWLTEAGPVLADGAMGTMLHAAGAPIDACFDALNLDRPALVLEIHRAYLRAGADLIETNSFGANAFKLAAHGLEGRLQAINAAAVDLARQAVRQQGSSARIAGSVGPLGVRLAPYGRISAEQAFRAFEQQMRALLEAGADLLVVETHSDLEEVRQALRAARGLGEVPVVASLTFTRDDRTLLGETPSGAARALAEAGADALGANCSGGPSQLLRVLGEMRRAAPQALLAVMPNAGWPERSAGRIFYPATPEYLAGFAVAFRQAGARVIGGCCGTTPEHIAAMRAALAAPAAVAAARDPAPDQAAPEPAYAAEEPTPLAQRLAAGRFVVAVEVDPPRGLSTHRLLAGAQLLAEAGADVINVADSPMARMRMSPWAVCHALQQAGIDTVLHFPTRGRNLLRVQGDLLAAHALGARNVLVVMGDPTAVGDFPEAMDNYDLVPSGLIGLIKRGFNAGLDHAGADLGGPTSFFIGCALDLCSPDPERELRTLHRKLKAGADFALTQPVFDPPAARRFLARLRDGQGAPSIPVLMGVLPLASARHAAFLQQEVPGVRIPDAVVERLTRAGSAARAEGARIAHELVQELQGQVQGVYLMPPFGRFDHAAEWIEQLRAAGYS